MGSPCGRAAARALGSASHSRLGLFEPGLESISATSHQYDDLNSKIASRARLTIERIEIAK